MDDQDCPRSKRQKIDKGGRFAALAKLKQLKGKGVKNKYEVSDVDSIFDTVDEKEYSKKVYERQSEDWIVDDDGSGYVEDGRDIFDDDLDEESIAQSSKTARSSKKKRLSRLSKGGGGNIQAMISNMPEKKKTEVNLDDDELLTEILGSMNDEKPSSNTTPSKSSSYIDEEKLEAKNYLKSFSAPKPIKTNLKTKLFKSNIRKMQKAKAQETPLSEIQNIQEDDIVDVSIESENVSMIEHVSQSSEFEATNDTELDMTDDANFDDDFDVSGVDLDEIKESKETISKEESKVTEAELISGWETMQDGTNINPEPYVPVNTDELPCVLNEAQQQVFRFYWWDAYEDHYKRPGVVYLFGKVYVENAKSYASCCVTVRNIDRRIYLLPRTFSLEDDMKTESDHRVLLTDVYVEFNDEVATKLKLQRFLTKKVTRKYAFDSEIPKESEYLEVRYPATNDSLDPKTTGKHFSKIFGTNTSFLEILLLERKIKGPCWLDIVNPSLAKTNYSYCKFEVNCSSPKDLLIPNELQNQPPPPLTVATLNIRAIVNPDTRMSEIVMIGCLIHTKYSVLKKPPNPPFENHFCVFTTPTNQSFPVDLYTSLQDYKATKVQKCDSEKALLKYFINQFEKVDPDVVIGHDLIDYYFGLICNRIEYTKFNEWSRFGKLKRFKRPIKSREIKELMVGHLVCDLKISAKELIRARSYDLDTLFEQILNIRDERLSANDISRMFYNSANILKLISLTMEDAAHITKIVYELNVIPLALQITNIAGNVMSRTLLGGRSERNEFLLLHAFTEKDYIPPDKVFNKAKEKEKDNELVSTSNRKKPTYSGGLVLDPKVGFYDTFILLMDFNSLYPSIIQEYNICFTTLGDSVDLEKELRTNTDKMGILPTEIKKLVDSRREVKKLMANPDISPEVRMKYNIRQMALKLTANSMYGCLGFASSRFYAKHLASLVTMKGRDILIQTRDLVQSMAHEVIYGDTDSIMINSNSTDYDAVIQIGQNIKKSVNKRYRQLELEVDGVFKYMLLLKKKKYAAITMSKDKKGNFVLKEEYKGLDIVRRDWSQLACEVGKVILKHIFSEQSQDERIENINTNLTKVASDLRENKIPLALLVITKQLSKDPKQYNDKNLLSHVQVALRYNQRGGKPLLQGDTVPYVVCDDGTEKTAVNRAYHIDELKKSDTLKIDINYYLAQQIHPVVSRLCEPIDGLDEAQIANMLGLDPTKYKQYKSKPVVNEPTQQALGTWNLFKNCTPFTFKCPGCKEINEIKPPKTQYIPLVKCSNEKCSLCLAGYVDYMGNWLQSQVRNFSEKYYKSDLICEDPLCTNQIDWCPIKFAGPYPVCSMCHKGVMYPEYSERDLYLQLKYFKHIFDLDTLEKKPTHLNTAVLEAYKVMKEKADRYIKQSEYSVIKLEPLFEHFQLRKIAWIDQEHINEETDDKVDNEDEE